MSDLVCCRYNKNHKVKRSRLVIHEYKCPDKDKNPNIIVSPFDPNEKIHIKNYEKHCKKYEQKIDDELKEKMKEYIKDKNNEDNYQKLQEIRVKELNGNYNEEKNNIIGMDKKKKKKPKKSNYEILNDEIKLKQRDDYIENEVEFIEGIKNEGITFEDDSYTHNFSNDLFSVLSEFETFEDSDFDPNKYDLDLNYLNKQNMIKDYH